MAGWIPRSLKYGSDQFDVQKVGVKDIEVRDGGKTVSLQLENLKPGYIYELTMGALRSEEGEVLENRLAVPGQERKGLFQVCRQSLVKRVGSRSRNYLRFLSLHMTYPDTASIPGSRPPMV